MTTSCNHIQMTRIAVGLLVAVLSLSDHRPAWGIDNASPKVTFTTDITSDKMPVDDIDRVSYDQKELYFHVQWRNSSEGAGRPLISYVFYDGAGNVAQKARQRLPSPGMSWNWAASMNLVDFIHKSGMWKLEILVDRKLVAEKYVNVATAGTIDFFEKKFERDGFGFKFWYPDTWSILKENSTESLKQVTIVTKPKSFCGFINSETSISKMSDQKIKEKYALLDAVSQKSMPLSEQRSLLQKDAGERVIKYLANVKKMQKLMGIKKLEFANSEIVKTSDGNQTRILANIYTRPNKPNKRATVMMRITVHRGPVMGMFCGSRTKNFARQKPKFQVILNSFVYQQILGEDDPGPSSAAT
jgi:hypothetical protein